MSDDLLKQWDPRLQDPLSNRNLEWALSLKDDPVVRGMTPEQRQSYDTECAEVERLWNTASLEEVLTLVLSPQEVTRVREELVTRLPPDEVQQLFGRPVRELPQGFGFEPADSPIQLGLARKLEPLRGPLYDLVCVQWDYCAHRDGVALGLGFALSLLAFLITQGLTTSVPLAGLIVGGVRAGYFDKLCECGQSRAGDA